MQRLGDFKLPQFFNYPPYFTLQPVRDTREKQVQLWKELIADYCKSQKIFVINLEEDFALFSNTSIERSLTHEAKEMFLSALVTEGRGEWLDKYHKKCLILWHRIPDWADILLEFARDNGLDVTTIEEIHTGFESKGTGFEIAGFLRLPAYVLTQDFPDLTKIGLSFGGEEKITKKEDTSAELYISLFRFPDYYLYV